MNRMALAVGIGVGGGLLLWALTNPPAQTLEARVAACENTQHEVAMKRGARGRAPPGEPSDAAVIAKACAPLFTKAPCREAMERFDSPPADERVPAEFRACARAYCPALPAPKPTACEADPATLAPEQILGQWSDLRAAMLRLEAGEDAARRLTGK